MGHPRANATIESSRGRVIARFSGAPTALVASQFPEQGTGRVHVATGTGTGSFRVQGFTQVTELPLYAAAPIPVVPGHLWITAGQNLRFVASTAGKLRVEHRGSAPFAQAFSAWTPCSSVTLEPRPAPAWRPDGYARSYILKKLRLDLYNAPREGVAAVFSLARSPDVPGALFFSTERREGWVRLEHHGEITVDAWALASDLEALAPGEIMDQLGVPTTTRLPARLAVQGEPRILKVPREVPLRTIAKDTEPPIGVIEAETEIYVLDVVMGWANVMPKALNVVPAQDGQFWAKTRDLGIGP